MFVVADDVPIVTVPRILVTPVADVMEKTGEPLGPIVKLLLESILKGPVPESVAALNSPLNVPVSADKMPLLMVRSPLVRVIWPCVRVMFPCVKARLALVKMAVALVPVIVRFPGTVMLPCESTDTPVAV